MTLQTLIFIACVQTILSALVAFLALVKFNSREGLIKLIGVAFLLGFLANAMAFVFHELHIGTNIIYSIYDLITACVISLIFYHALSKRYGKWFFIISLCFSVFVIINLLWVQKQSIGSYNKFISSFIIITYCIFYFYRLMIELPSTHLQRMPMFWFNSAFLIYYAGALILFVFTSYIINVLNDNLIPYWIFHNVLNICEHFIVLIGLYYDLKNIRLGKMTNNKAYIAVEK